MCMCAIYAKLTSELTGCTGDKFGPNKGLDYIKDVLAPIYDQYKNYLSLADFWVICANAAIKSSVAAEDAPLTVGFKYGRSDIDCSDCDATVAARLPDESKSTDHVEEVFVTRMVCEVWWFCGTLT